MSFAEGYTRRPKGHAIGTFLNRWDTKQTSFVMGGVPGISPLLSNIALHGLETATKTFYAEAVYSGPGNVAKRDR